MNRIEPILFSIGPDVGRFNYYFFPTQECEQQQEAVSQRSQTMATSSCSAPCAPLLIRSQLPQRDRIAPSNLTSKNPSQFTTLQLNRRPVQKRRMAIRAVGFQDVAAVFQTFPPTWQSSIACNLVIFTLGSPLLVAGLSLPGIASAFILGTLTWRAFVSAGFLLVAAYFVIGTAVTKVKMAQKEVAGVAEKRKGRRGPGSVFGSSAAGCVCALVSIYGAPREQFHIF